MIIKKQLIQIHKNLKTVRIKESNTANRLTWLFQPSFYQIFVIDIVTPYPCIKVCSQSPIQYFTTIYSAHQQTHYLIVVDSLSNWVAYELACRNKQIAVEQIYKSSLADIQSKVIGIHLISTDNTMILFSKANGRFEYNYLCNEQKGGKFCKINKLYQLQDPNDKYRKGNLYSKYQGRELLQQLAQHKIICTAFKQNSKELIVAVKDSNSGVCSIHRFFIQYYQVMAGMDLLFNLPSPPLEIIALPKMVVINLGYKMLAWAKNTTQQIQFNEAGSFCTSLQVENEEQQTMACCFAKGTVSTAFRLTMDLQGKEVAKPVTYKFDKLAAVQSAELIVHCSSVQSKQVYPIVGVNCKLEVVWVEKEKQSKTVLANMQATIVSGSVQQKSHANYIRAVKKVGYLEEHKIISSNYMVAEMQQYQHNMLLKMAHCLKHTVLKDKAELYLSSPIIGTLKLAFQITSNANNQSGVLMSAGSSEAHLITDQQSLFIDSISNQQITPTKLLTSKSKYSVGQLFQATTDFILKGCIVGGFGLLLVEKQVHIFSIEPKPKRMHIYCFDYEVKDVIGLNSVNMWAALLWDGSMQILRIHQKQSIKIHQISSVHNCDIGAKLSYNISINTAPHTFTLMANHLFICSNDPLHIYQAEKTTLKIVHLNEGQFGKHFYPFLDLTPSKTGNQKFAALSNVGSKWAILTFAAKYLVKDVEEIKVQVQQILAFPQPQNLIAAILKDNSLVLLCSTRILTLTLHTGPITYKSATSLAEISKQSKQLSLCYLKKWLANQQISYSKLKVQNLPNARVSHPNIIKMGESKALLCGQKQIWYTSIKNNVVKNISYFAMSNDAFIEFRNNLGVLELENAQFMEMFAEKLPIFAVARVSQFLFAVLYEKVVVIVQIHSNGGLAIKQTLPFSECPGLLSISQFIGVYDEMSLYMKDAQHRLILLKYNAGSKKHYYQIQQQLQDDIVTISRVKGWKQRGRKITIMGKQTSEYEELRIKKDGQLVVGNDVRRTYI